MFLADAILGKPQSDAERAVDRYFFNRSASNIIASFFDPDARRRKLEEQLMERALTSDSLTENIKTGISLAAVLRKPAKTALAHLLAP